MGQKIGPTLEFGLAMPMSDAVAEITKFGGAVDKVSAQAIRDLDKIDNAIKGVGTMSASTAGMVQFADETAKAAINAARELGRIEKAGESLSAQLGRQIEVFGKSAVEIRAMKVETAALAAEQKGLAELSNRLLDQQAALVALESQAADAATAEAAAMRDAAIAHQLFEKAATAGAAALRDEQAALDVAEIRNASVAYQQFEARVRAGADALREQDAQAAKDAKALQQLREMLDPAGAAQARLNEELTEARRLMLAAGSGAEELARAETLITQRHAEVVRSSGSVRAGMQQLSFQLNDVATGFSSGTPPMQIFAQQAGQVTQALSLMTSGTKGLLGFLGGPWGLVLTSAFVLLTPLVAKLFEGADAADKNAAALRTVKGATEALDEATGRLHRTKQQEITDSDVATKALLREALAKRELLKAFVDAANAPGAAPEVAVAGQALSATAGAANDRAIKALQASLSGTGFARVLDEVTRATDKGAEATHRYQLAEADIKKAMEAGLITRERAKQELLFEKSALDSVKDADKNAAAAKREHTHELSEHAKAARAAAKEAREAAREQADWDKHQADLAHDLAVQRAQDAERIGKFNGAIDLSKGIGQADFDPIGTGMDAAGKFANSLKGPLDDFIEELAAAAEQWDLIARNADRAASGMADAFGNVGQAIGEMTSLYANYLASVEAGKSVHETRLQQATTQAEKERENTRYSIEGSGRQIALYGDMAAAAKGFFKSGSDGYKALADAEKVFRAVQFALSVRAMAQDAIETAGSIAKSVARTATYAVEAVVSAIKSLPFPLNIAAGAATIGALAGIGVGIAGSFGGSNKPAASNSGTGTVLGDPSAKSESLQRSIDMLKEVDDATLGVSRDMLISLRAIQNAIGNVSNLIVRAGSIDASAGVNVGFQKDALGKALSGAPSAMVMGAVGSLIAGPVGYAIGTAVGALTNVVKKIPVIGDIIGGISSLVGSLFGSKTSIVGGGIYGGGQAVGDILSNGFDAQSYSDIQKKKKFFGLTTGTSYSTVYGNGVDDGISNQFALILRGFNDAIVSAAGPLGESTQAITDRVGSFVFTLGKIDLKDLTGDEIQEKLEAVFGAAGDKMAQAAIPGLERFEKVGDGYLETLIRVASTVEQVDAVFQRLGKTSTTLGVNVDMAIAGMFENASDFTSLADSYFTTFYSDAEQTAAKTAQMQKAFTSLGMSLPGTIAGYRQLVDAQDLTTTAGQQMYVTLLQLAPAFADLQGAAQSAATAAAIVRERQDLQSKLLELTGDTAALRAAELAKLDPSNRALQQQIYAIQDAQDAAKAAEQLRQAWTSVGDSIMDEVKRIRGLSDASTGGSFAGLLGQFNAANSAARMGDQEAAKTLPGLSKSLLDAAALAATSRQELDRVQAQTAASLEQTYGAITALAGGATSGTAVSDLASLAASQSAAGPASPNDDLITEMKALRDEVAQLRLDNNSGHAANAAANSKSAKILETVSSTGGGDAFAVASAA